MGDYGDYGNDSCPITCPAECSEFDIVCSNGVDENGCSLGDYCMPATYQLSDGVECPAACYDPCDWTAGEVSCPIYSDEGCLVVEHFANMHMMAMEKFFIPTEICMNE